MKKDRAKGRRDGVLKQGFKWKGTMMIRLEEIPEIRMTNCNSECQKRQSVVLRLVTYYLLADPPAIFAAASLSKIAWRTDHGRASATAKRTG